MHPQIQAVDTQPEIYRPGTHEENVAYVRSCDRQYAAAPKLLAEIRVNHSTDSNR